MYLISKRYTFLVSLCPSKQSLYLCMLCKDSIKFSVSIFVEQLELRQQEAQLYLYQRDPGQDLKASDTSSLFRIP